MQPLSLATSLYPRGLTTGLSSSPLVAPQADAARSTLGSAGNSGGQFNVAAMLPMMLQLLQVIMQMMQTMLGGGSPAKAAAGSAGNAGLAGGTGNAGSGGGYGGSSGIADNGLGVPGGVGANPVVPGGAIPGSPSVGPGTSPVPFGGLGVNPFPGGVAADQSIDQRRGLDYTQLNAQQRQQFNGLTRESAAILHLGGRAHVSDDASPSGVSSSARMYTNVLANPNNFSPQEVALVQQWRNDEIAKY
jgi:hypothetical protein